MLLALTSATYMQQASVSRMGRVASVARPIAMRGLGSSGQYLAPTAVAATGAFSPGGVQSRNYLTKSWFNSLDDKIDKLEAKVDAEYDILADQHDNITEDSKELEALRDKKNEARGLSDEYDEANEILKGKLAMRIKNERRGIFLSNPVSPEGASPSHTKSFNQEVIREHARNLKSVIKSDKVWSPDDNRVIMPNFQEAVYNFKAAQGSVDKFLAKQPEGFLDKDGNVIEID